MKNKPTQALIVSLLPFVSEIVFMRSTNAIITSALFLAFAIAGLVLGIRALRGIKSISQNGKGIAITAIVISSFELFLVAVGIIIALIIGLGHRVY